MLKWINIKTIISAGFVLLSLNNYWKAFVRLGTQHSIDVAAGFVVGLLAAGFLFIQLKCVSFLYSVALEWWSERKAL